MSTPELTWNLKRAVVIDPKGDFKANFFLKQPGAAVAEDQALSLAALFVILDRKPESKLPAAHREVYEAARQMLVDIMPRRDLEAEEKKAAEMLGKLNEIARQTAPKAKNFLSPEQVIEAHRPHPQEQVAEAAVAKVA